MPRPIGQLERGLGDLTIGMEQAKARRGRINEASGAGEVEQQVRVPVAGTAANGWGFVDGGVGFEMPFIWLPAQRMAPFKTPHFSYGIEHIVAGDQLVLIHASVIKWNVDKSSRVLGARVRFAASAPQAAEEELVEFSAEAHLRFQGWAGDVEEVVDA